MHSFITILSSFLLLSSCAFAKNDTNLTSDSNTTAHKSPWVVDGHVLPPEPDPMVNNATLLGVDVNHNGVRDDVERWIYETYDEYVPCHQELDYNDVEMIDGEAVPNAIQVCEEHPIPYHPIVRAVAMQGARAAQIIIQEPEKAKETREIFAKAYLCSSVIEDFKDIKIVDKDILGKEFDKIQFNTTKRARAYAKYNYYLSGGIYRMPTDKKILENCPSDVKVLLEELR